MTSRAVLLLIFAIAGCAAPSRPTTIAGVARDAKSGAVVIGDDGAVVEVAGLDAWPAELEGRRVSVMGRLTQREGATSLVNDAGEHSAGSLGPHTVIEGATWRPAE